MDDSKSLHGKWLFNQTSIKKWLFRVPGGNEKIIWESKLILDWFLIALTPEKTS